VKVGVGLGVETRFFVRGHGRTVSSGPRKGMLCKEVVFDGCGLGSPVFEYECRRLKVLSTGVKGIGSPEGM
jgi:hypothetical protein